jgi:hypothetical protein
LQAISILAPIDDKEVNWADMDGKIKVGKKNKIQKKISHFNFFVYLCFFL